MAREAEQFMLETLVLLDALPNYPPERERPLSVRLPALPVSTLPSVISALKSGASSLPNAVLSCRLLQSCTSTYAIPLSAEKKGAVRAHQRHTITSKDVCVALGGATQGRNSLLMTRMFRWPSLSAGNSCTHFRVKAAE